MKTLPLRMAGDFRLAQARLVMPGDGYGEWNLETAAWSHRLEASAEPLVEFYLQPDYRPSASDMTPFGRLIGDERHTVAAALDVLRLLHLPSARHLKFDDFSRDLATMWLASHPLLPAAACESEIRSKRLQAVAQQTVKDFQYECVARSDNGFDQIWRCSNPRDGNYAHDLVVSRYGISAFGDMDSLTFNVGASYGLEFLAGRDVEHYIHSKLDAVHRSQVEIDPGQIDALLGESLLKILDTYWFENPALQDGGGPHLSEAAHRAEQALRSQTSRANLSRLIIALATDDVGGCEKLPQDRLPQAVARDFTKMMNDLRNQRDDHGLIECLESWESDFDVNFRDLLDGDWRLTRPSSNVITRLYVLNIGAQRILEQKRQQEIPDPGLRLPIRERG